MTEDTLQNVLVIALVVSALLEAIVHGATWWVLRNQRDSTSVGSALRWQMAGLAVRFGAMTGFHVLLAWLVLGGGYPFGFVWRVALYAAVLLSALASSWYGLILIQRLYGISAPPPDLGDEEAWATPDHPP